MGLFSRKPKNLSPAEQRRLDCDLIAAATQGNLEETRELLANGANVHAKVDDALCYAASRGHTEVVAILLTAGADVHAQNDYALCRAAHQDHTETVRVLGAHIFAPDSWRGKSRANIEAQASALYERIKTLNPSNPIKSERLRKAAIILFECATDCWHRVRPVPKLKISPTPAQPRPL